MAPSQNEHADPLVTDEKAQSQDDSIDLRLQQYIHHRRKQLLARLLHSLRPPQLLRQGKRLGYTLAPTIIRSLIWDEHGTPPKKFPTSYLNGLRGVTAVKVFTFHYTFVYSDFGFQPWGVDERHKHFLELPIIRYFYSGFTSHVFFGIAGYLTSLRLFQLLDKNDTVNHSKVLLNVSGSLFRRALRLYLPVFLITIITTSYIHMGFYESNRPLILDHDNLFPGDWYEPKPDMAPTWSLQIQHWCHEMFDLTNIVTEQTVYPDHDQHLWSILSEMRASLQLYGILIAVAQCKPHIRIIIMLFLLRSCIFSGTTGKSGSTSSAPSSPSSTSSSRNTTRQTTNPSTSSPSTKHAQMATSTRLNLMVTFTSTITSLMATSHQHFRTTAPS